MNTDGIARSLLRTTLSVVGKKHLRRSASKNAHALGKIDFLQNRQQCSAAPVLFPGVNLENPGLNVSPQELLHSYKPSQKKHLTPNYGVASLFKMLTYSRVCCAFSSARALSLNVICIFEMACSEKIAACCARSNGVNAVFDQQKACIFIGLWSLSRTSLDKSGDNGRDIVLPLFDRAGLRAIRGRLFGSLIMSRNFEA